MVNPETHANFPRDAETVERAVSRRSAFSTSEIFEELDSTQIPDYRLIRNLEKESRRKADEEEAARERIEAIREGGQSILIGGRKSKRKPEPKPSDEETVYYASKETWLEDAEQGSKRVLGRQAKKEDAKEQDKQTKLELAKFEKTELSRLRGEIYGRADDRAEYEVEPLPKPRPVLPVILKTKTVGMFDAMLDEIERIEARFGLSIPVVHGGIGNISQDDVVHAEIEKNYGYCPVYGVQVSVNPSAKGMAEKHNVALKTYEVFTEVLEDITKRCTNITQRVESAKYQVALRGKAPATRSGM